MAINYSTTPNMQLQYVDPDVNTPKFVWNSTATTEYPSANKNPLFLSYAMTNIDNTDMADRLDALETGSTWAGYIHTGVFSKTRADITSAGIYGAEYSIDTGIVGDPWIIMFFPLSRTALTGNRETDGGMIWLKGKRNIHCDFTSSDNIGLNQLTLEVNAGRQLGDNYYATLKFDSPTRVPPHACMFDGALYSYIVIGKKVPE